MSNWYAKNLGDAMLAAETVAQVEEKFRSLYAQTSNPAEKAVFIRHQADGHLHCEVWLYLPPATGRLAKEIAAHPCDRPSANGLGLLVGPDDCWQELFLADRRY